MLARLMGTDLTVMISGESGTGKELVARALHDYRQAAPRAVRRHQHGGDPARADRERAVRPREGRLHRRGSRKAAAGKFEQAQRRHALPRRDRRHAAGGADPAAAGAAGGRVHRGRRPRRADPADVRIVAATHRDLRPAGPPGPVPRGSLLPPERGADAPAAAARAATRTSRPVAPFPGRGQDEGLPAKRLDGGAWPAARYTIGRAMCASWRTSSAGSRRSLQPRRSSVSRNGRGSIRAPEAGRSGRRRRGPRRTSPGRGRRAASAGLFRRMATSLPPPGLYDRVLREVERPLIELTLVRHWRQPTQGGELLGLNRNTLRKKIRDLEISGAVSVSAWAAAVAILQQLICQRYRPKPESRAGQFRHRFGPIHDEPVCVKSWPSTGNMPRRRSRVRQSILSPRSEPRA